MKKKTKTKKNKKLNNIKIVSWNVNGLRSKSMSVIENNKLNEKSNLFELIQNYDPDILCFCETKCQKEHEQTFKDLLPYEYQEWNSSIDKLGSYSYFDD